MIPAFYQNNVKGKVLNFSHIIKKFNPNEDISSPSFIYFNKDKMPLPCLTPAAQKRITPSASDY
jgi:hypothetical protein